MTLFGYKDYQQRTLKALADYLALAREDGADLAFYKQTKRAYRAVDQLPGLPYVCLRVPTGGGKTVLACHAIAVALQEFLRQERGVVLWLAPTNTIKEQTLNALRDRRHPYRQVLDATLEGKITALDLTESLALPRATLDAETVIIVSTMAALRVENVESRKVYEQSGALMSHFDDLPPEVLASLERYEGTDKPIPSLANVLKLRRPLTIVDEAHHLRTELSFDTLARFAPSCILEFTATPHTGSRPSNVLYQVSASELKAESMIKLPIQLQLPGGWTDVIAGAVAMQGKLEQDAQAEQAQGGQYLRPIVLVQAQPKNQEVTVEVIKQRLLDSGIPAEQIAVETGSVHELGAANLFSSSCPVRYIITVDKLREGWDCSFAYILCSVREMHAKTPIEQILGRILRMPQAERKRTDSLNLAYAFVTSQNVRQVVESLTGALAANGLSRWEAAREIEQTALDLGGLFSEPKQDVLTPSQRGELFSVPQLALWHEGEWEPVDENTFLRTGWTLADGDASLSESEFASQLSVEQYMLDVNAQGKTSLQQAERVFISDLQCRLALLTPEDVTTTAGLAVWLDRHIPHPDLTQSQASLFLLRLIENLMTQRGLTLEQLSRERLRLRDAAERKINDLRKASALQNSQQLLFHSPPDELQTSSQCVFSFAPGQYPANTLYEGAFRFKKHFYPLIGDMNGEETDCARLLDMHPKVRYWVRNLERRPTTSFWLQTATDKFYPDFMALLDDERVIAVEYKGGHLETNDDTDEKRKLGALWAARSGGRCIFQLVSHTDYAHVLSAI